MRIASCIGALAIVVAMTPPADAQSAEAETLFREGKRLMKKGRIAEACDKFEGSERLEPSLGTELRLGDCREKNGQTASAWVAFVKAATNAKHATDKEDKEAYETEARHRASLLEKQLVYLTIAVPAESAIDDLVIKRNDTPIDRALWNQAMPVDPDDYTISAEAPDHASWSEKVAVKTKNKVIEVPKLERDDHAAAHGETLTPKHARTDRDEPRKRKRPPPERPEAPRKYTSATIALAAVGIGAVAVGTGFALYSSSLESQSDTVCPTTDCTDSHAVELNKLARLDGWIANVAWSVGGAALASAVVAWWLGSPARDGDTLSIVPIVAHDHAGFAIGGRF